MLNAFRHQRKVHRRASVKLPALPCAQRLSASEEGSRSPISPNDSPSIGCSTPFGIRGRFTRTRRGIDYEPFCAQRLSASEEGSLRPSQGASLQGVTQCRFMHLALTRFSALEVVAGQPNALSAASLNLCLCRVMCQTLVHSSTFLAVGSYQIVKEQDTYSTIPLPHAHHSPVLDSA